MTHNCFVFFAPVDFFARTDVLLFKNVLCVCQSSFTQTSTSLNHRKKNKLKRIYFPFVPSFPFNALERCGVCFLPSHSHFSQLTVFVSPIVDNYLS